MKKLSKREYQVLLGYFNGHKSKTIAKTLNVNQKTIGTYKNRIKTKLGLEAHHNDFAMVATAIDMNAFKHFADEN